MSAFTPSRRYQIEQVIDRLAQRLVNNIKNTVTHDDIIKCFIKPEHRQMSVDMFDIFGATGSARFSYVHSYKGDNRATLQVAVAFGDKDTHFSIPNYASGGMVPDAPEDAVERINKWVQKRIAIGREFGFAKDTFMTIADRCASPKAVVFLMPSVLTLIANIPIENGDVKLKKFHDALTRTGQPPLPALTPALREATMAAAATFTRALLLDHKSETAVAHPVNLMLSSVPSIKNPWGTTQTFI